MSRESNLIVSFAISDSEIELVNQVCGTINGLYSFDKIIAEENGISIFVWNSEHYYLAEVMPHIVGTIAAFFPDRHIDASGTGTNTVMDDTHEYGADYCQESRIIVCRWHHYCGGMNKNYGTQYCALGPGITASDFNELNRSAKAQGYNLAFDALSKISADPALQTSAGKICWCGEDSEAICAYLSTQRDVCIPNYLNNCFMEFSASSQIETVSFGDAIESIGKYAFRGCKSLREVKIPNNIKYISDEAFANCTALEKVKIECDIDTLPPKLFLNCDSLKEVIISGKMKSITKTFQNLKKLETVVLPEGLAKLGPEAFANCPLLVNINLPQSIKTIAENAFTGCERLNLDIPAGVQVVSPFEVQDDLLIKAIMCIQTADEARDFFDFAGKGKLNSFKTYDKLIMKYESEPWYIEYQKKLREENNIALLNEIKKQYCKMSRDEYLHEFFQQFVDANEYEQAKKLVKESFSEKEIQKLNKALTAYFMFASGYKYKEISSTLDISSSLVNTISRSFQYGGEESNVILRAFNGV